MESAVTNILVLHHNDRDGYMSAAVIGDYYNNHYADKSNITYKEVDYTDKLCRLKIDDMYLDAVLDHYEIIFLVDYSISNIENHDFVKRHAGRIIWIDHHKSSFIPMNDDLKDIHGIRCIGLSGALLTWIYFNEYMMFEKLQHVDELSKEEVDGYIKRRSVPDIIAYTHWYDVWNIDDSVVKFNFGHYDLSINKMMNDIIKTDKMASPETYCNENPITKYIKDGKTIKDYIVHTHEKHIDQYGIPFTIIDDLGEEPKEYSVIAVNMFQPTSLKFGRYADEYNILMPFYYSIDGFSYSLYRGTNAPEDLDVSVFAEDLGGGGHKGAAGFFIPQNKHQIPLRKDEVLYLSELVKTTNTFIK